MNLKSIDLIKKHFGQDAEFHRDLVGVTRISNRCGVAAFKEERFQSVIGGSDMYRAALLFSAEMWGQVRATGTSVHILACMAHGKELGLSVIPEGDTEGGGQLTIGCAGIVFCYGIMAGMFFLNVHSFKLLEFSGVAAIVAALIAYPLLKKLLAKDALRAGQQYRDIFPEVHGSERKADREAARERGLL